MTQHLLILVGLVLVGGLWAAKGARWVRLPQVVGFVVAGLILGPSVLALIDDRLVEHLEVISWIALAIIGYTIGSELRWRELRALGRAILAIVPLEAMGAFILIGLGAWALTGQAPLAVLLAAMGSATAPAGTVDVLREYKARGPMTTVLYAVTGLDDAVALILFGFGLPLARSLLEPESVMTIQRTVIEPLEEIGLSLALGLAVGGLLVLAGRWTRSRGESLVLVLGLLLVTAGLAQWGELSPILASMSIGVLAANFAPEDTARTRRVLDDWAQPLLLIFFALVGGRLLVRGKLLEEVGVLSLVYMVTRFGGKAAGTWVGGWIGRAQPSVRKYVGLGLLSQAGVQIGLALLAFHELERIGTPEALASGHAIISTIMLTTLVTQLIAPPLLRLALVKSGESPMLAAEGAAKGAR